jgi:hypothetical protein
MGGGRAGAVCAQPGGRDHVCDELHARRPDAAWVRGYRLDSVGSAIVLLATTGLWLLCLRGATSAAAPEAPAPPMDTITQP